jgi:hypothetical protein
MIARENATNMREKNAERGEFLIDKGTPGSLKEQPIQAKRVEALYAEIAGPVKRIRDFVAGFLTDCCYGIASSEPRRLFKIVKNNSPSLFSSIARYEFTPSY